MISCNMREKSVRDYFAMWLDRECSRLDELFADNVIYEESVGTEYHGLEQLRRWFFDWNRTGEVKRWDISRFTHCGCTTFVEWYFECVYDGQLSGFDGVTIAEFDSSGKICSLREFASQHEHTMPYGD